MRPDLARDPQAPLTEASTFTSHMADAADPAMEAIASHLGMTWVGGAWGDRLAGLRNGSIAAGWICGLLYADLRALRAIDLVPVAAPVMATARYGDRPVYFGDLVVKADSEIVSLDDLDGTTVAFNEPSSLSGYRMLLDRFGALDVFSQAVESGSHAESMRMVSGGAADVASIDSTLLDMLAVSDPSAVEPLRVIGNLGPYPAPPIVAAPDAAQKLQAGLASMHEEPVARTLLAAWGIRRFATVQSHEYEELAVPR